MIPFHRNISRLSKRLAIIALCLSGATVHAENPATVTGNAPSNPATVTGKAATRNIAAEMTALYNNTVNICPPNQGTGEDLDRPAFLCSGIIIRTATNDNQHNPPQFYVWDISPSSTIGFGPNHEGQGAVSFSWISRNMTFADLGASGYTVYPLFGPYSAHDTRKTTVLKVLCAFPMDAWSNFRTEKGCGPGTDPNTKQFVGGGTICQDQNIFTGDAWVRHFLNPAPGAQSYLWQCGFDVSSSPSRPGNLRNGQAFLQWMLARGEMEQKYPEQTFKDRNELRIEDWPAGTRPATLPIQSFYYTAGNGPGWIDARKSQVAYYNLTGMVVPVIRITVPTLPLYTVSYDDPRVAFHFEQLPGDQAVQ